MAGRNISKLKMAGIISSILLLSLAIFSTTEEMPIALAQQANAPKLVKVNATNGLFEANLGAANFYGKGGVDPQAVFPPPGCPPSGLDPIKCGVSAGKDSMFNGTFDQGNAHHLTAATATFTSPITTGELKSGHTYKITITDNKWNNTDTRTPTIWPGFARTVNNVNLHCQLQHGASLIDRSEVPPIFECPGVMFYGHAIVTDITNGANTPVAKVFAHEMLGHIINQTNYFKYMRADPISPNLGIVIVANIPSDIPLPGQGWAKHCSKPNMCTAEEANGFFPLTGDPSLTHPPQFKYPITTPPGTNITAPGVSYQQPVNLKDPHFFFATLVFPGANIHEVEMPASGGK